MLGRYILDAARIAAFFIIMLLLVNSNAIAQGSGVVVATVRVRPPVNNISDYLNVLSLPEIKNILNNITENSFLYNDNKLNQMLLQLDRQRVTTNSAIFR